MELIEKISEITWLVTILKAVLLLAFTYLAVLVIDRTFTKIGRNENLNLKFLNSFLKGLAWVIGVLQVVALVPGMSSFTKTLLAGSGIAAVVLGLAAQESFGNLISGMLIAVFHPFQVGDRVHLINNDLTGFVGGHYPAPYRDPDFDQQPDHYSQFRDEQGKNRKCRLWRQHSFLFSGRVGSV